MGIMNKMKTVDLGTSNFTYYAVYDGCYVKIDDAKPNATILQLDGYTVVSDQEFNAYPKRDKVMTVNVYNTFKIRNLSFPKNAAGYKQALQDKILTYETIDSVEEKIAGPQVKFPDVHVSSYSASLAPPIALSPGLYRFDWTFTGGTDAGARDSILPIYMDGEVDYANAIIGPSYGQVRRAFTIKNKPLRWFYFYGGTGNTSADYKNIVLTMIEQTEEII